MEAKIEEPTRIAGPQVGDVLVSSWGYDQTNVDFWRVEGLTASGKSVRIVPVAQRVHSYSKGCEHVVPGEGTRPRPTCGADSLSFRRPQDGGTDVRASS